MKDITLKQFKALKELHEAGGRLWLDDGLRVYWEMNPTYCLVLVSMGAHDWVVKLTDKGRDLLAKEDAG